ncbi:MAG TPA: hypothetical protein DD671_14550 [Balneolaceae bacterium]|nr:hypothetical protein [Balneola sp.]HBQ60794.1 hypothetical protein [Balneolaceae bacterium]|tara:strand:+ start:75756 stop:76796 length:1041 start_codon:yes stop_codon:yes gene_type:complete
MGTRIKTFFFTFLISVFLIGETSAQIGEMIYNPYNLWLAGDGEIVINDIADEKRTIKLFEFSSELLKGSIRSGRGPGEVSPSYYKRSTTFSNGDFLLWDAGRKRLMRYSSDLKYKTDVRGDATIGSSYQAGLINDSTLLTVDFSEEVFKAWRIKNNKISEGSLLWAVNRNEQKELLPLANFTLLQTLFYDNYDGMLYVTFEFSSMIIGINEDGIVFINDEPAKIPLPPVDPESEKSGRYSLPVMGKHPEGARDIAANDKFVYVLLNGETISKFQQMKYMVNFEALIEKTNHAKRLLIYNRFTGDFLKEIELPIPSKQAKISDDFVYLLHTLGEGPVVKRYKLSELH